MDGNVLIFVGVSFENDQGFGVYQFFCGWFDLLVKVYCVNNFMIGYLFILGLEFCVFDFGGIFCIGVGYVVGEWEGKFEFVFVIGMFCCIIDYELMILYQFWKGYCLW